MALAISGTSPATVTSGSNPNLSTASFTPPNNSLIVALWSGNSATATVPSGPPVVSDNRLGGSLSWTRRVWECRSDFAADGQAAIFTAPSPVGAAMGVTVQNLVATPTGVALSVVVLTDSNALIPGVGVNGKGGQNTGTAVPMTYTASTTGSWGFSTLCDWDVRGAPTAGTGTTLIGGGSAGTGISYGHFRRTTADGVAATALTLNGTLPLASGNLQWAALEVLPGGVTIVATYLNQLRDTRDQIARDLGTDATLGSLQLRALSDADLTCTAMMMKALIDKGLVTEADFAAAMASTVNEGLGWTNLAPLA